MLYEDPTKDVQSEERFHIELHFSPGVNCCVAKNGPEGPGFRPNRRSDSTKNKSQTEIHVNNSNLSDGIVGSSSTPLVITPFGTINSRRSSDSDSTDSKSNSGSMIQLAPLPLCSTPVTITRDRLTRACSLESSPSFKGKFEGCLDRFKLQSTSLFSTAVITGHSPPGLHLKPHIHHHNMDCNTDDANDMDATTGSTLMKTPGVRPLETLHNALSLHQLDVFFDKILTTNYRPSSSSSILTEPELLKRVDKDKSKLPNVSFQKFKHAAFFFM